MVSQYLLDTDIIIDHLRTKTFSLKLIQKLQIEKCLFLISVITKAEVFAGLSMADLKIQNQVKEFLDSFQNIEINSQIAEKAGEFKRKYKVDLIDSLIGATAFFTNSILITRNLKDFQKIKEIKVILPK
ncbi:type II toxin-antitoxin system VapC family toxin [Patescibacteria group bacterium]|nr:type II toxin-antitoxin system VapC family toxin [Patescibacteria group bacterium]MBU4480816.1 type II toxin-antitoxin system VapC family toxin [Patescibacteria group bacterium]